MMQLSKLLVVQILVAGEDVALEFFLVRVPQLGGLGVERARAARVRIGISLIWGAGFLLVWFAQQALQAEQYARHVVYRAPLVLEDVETDAAGEVDVRVVDGGFEKDGGRRVGVVVRELEGELEDQALVGCFGWAGDGSCPGEQVAVGVGEGGDAGRGGEHELHELSLQAGNTGQFNCRSGGSEGTNRLVTLWVSFLWATFCASTGLCVSSML